jgi:DnaA-homolog protein
MLAAFCVINGNDAMRQLPLKLTLRDDATFHNFYPGDNEFVLSYLQNFVAGRGDSFVYLWGPAGTGRTHLLQACCQAIPKASAVFIDLAEPHLETAILQELDSCSLICLDNIDAVLRRCGWEIALFNLYNQSRDRGGKLLISALLPPPQLFCRLADLSSRLAAGLVLGLKLPTDEQKLSALQLRAKHRGLELSSDAGNFLLNHYPRNLHDLFSALETLDKEALSAKRRLTIPFIKQVLKL